MGSLMSSMGYLSLSLLGAESALLRAMGWWIVALRSRLISELVIYTTYCGFFLMKLKNCCANVSSVLCAISCVLRFLYRWLSYANPSFHDAIEEIARVWPWCSSFLRATLNWSLSRCDLNSPVFSLAVRVLAFSTTLITSELKVINQPLSSVRDWPGSSFWCAQCNLQGDLVSQHHKALAPFLPILALQPCTLQVLVYVRIYSSHSALSSCC
jgi:hypothetical protein